MLTSWIPFGDTWAPYHYRFNTGMQISYKKKAKYHSKLYKNNEFFSSENKSLLRT